MTQRQKLGLYFPTWQRAYRANWQRQGGLIRKPDRKGELLDQIEDIAAQLALQGDRQVVADDLRRACHVAATGTNCSSDALDNKRLDMVLAVFHLLIDPIDLSARMALEHPENDARRRLEWSVAHCGLDLAYVLHICHDKFGTKAWRSLNDTQLRQLVITLKNRKPAKQSPSAPSDLSDSSEVSEVSPKSESTTPF